MLDDAMAHEDGVDVLWFLPTHGDGRYLGTATGARQVSLDYLGQIARAADSLGYFGVLLPTGRSCEDSWVIASAMVPQTRRLRFLVAVRPGLQEPAMAARMAATLDRVSEGRLLINVVTGGDPVELRGDGIMLGHDERYAVTDEFLSVWRQLMAGNRVDFRGRHLAIEGVNWSSRLCSSPIHRSISVGHRLPGSASRWTTATSI
jgi:alkanesulfonate monooxygenase